MATSENKARQIKGSIDSILSWNERRDELLHRDLGKESFTEIENDLDTLIRLLVRLNSFNFKILPEKQSDDLLSLLNVYTNLFHEIQNYFGGSNLPKRTELIKRFEDHYSALFTYLCQLQSINSNLDDLVGKDWDILKEAMRKSFSESLQSFDANNNKMVVALETLHQLTEKNKDLGVKNYAALFGKEADSFGTKANVWLSVSAITFIAILFLGFKLLSIDFAEIKPNLQNQQDNLLMIYFIAQQTVTKILIASALFLALSICIKNYRANLHNRTINQHRSTALKSFQAFSESPSDAQTKNAVLLEATRTIFAHQTTGFNTSDKDAEMPNKIIEIIKPFKSDPT
jgi:hypothetical protein